MSSKKQLTKDEVSHVAKLATLSLNEDDLALFLIQISEILDLVSKLQKIDTKGIKETSQVTGLENIFREDQIDVTRMFSQEEALANAKEKYNGFFKVSKISWT